MATWGSLKKESAIPENLYGNGQGYFRYYNDNNQYHTIVAVNGKLLKDGGEIVIQGLESGFQTDRMIEAVQFKDKMFIATGTKLVEYDGTIAKVVEAYKPKPLEALYIGTNGLAENPDSYLEDGTEAFLRLEGVAPSLNKGIANTPTTFTAFVSKVNALDVIEYKFEYMGEGFDTFKPGKNWSTDKTWTFTPKTAGTYKIQVHARKQGSTSDPTEDSPQVFQMPYTVTAIDENKKVDTSQMHSCNRILLHWERLIVYGDKKNKGTIYISELGNPRYFPVLNTLEFQNNEQESLTKLVQYRDFIVAFMPSSIQALYGKAPIGNDPFRRMVLHTGIGCIAPETARVMGNNIAFLSRQGIHVLQSMGITEDKMNVAKIDSAIENEIPMDTDACAIVFRNQYHICFPRLNTRYRLYYERGMWTKDISPLMDFSRLFEWNGELVGQSQTTGKTYKFDDSVYTDAGHVYEDRVVTKSYNFGEPHNPKKMKEFQLILARYNTDVNLSVIVNVDNNPVLNTLQSKAEVVNDSIRWIEEHVPNVSVDAGTVFDVWKLGISAFDNAQQKKVSIPITGKGHTVNVDIRHQEDGPNALLSAGFIFKTKKP
ncbi:hypothetical protein [Metabacillus sp. cB07]|uniref:hypothetical protein n=1 Tax=Metabacillus sp. cB07 TaxID=2806989 RepID=UPI001939FED3|nr:hypothetical protein [Metabacillus sp. cB07]